MGTMSSDKRLIGILCFSLKGIKEIGNSQQYFILSTFCSVAIRGFYLLRMQQMQGD
jgi:hypothetical protein